jgi:hypothetical protein
MSASNSMLFSCVHRPCGMEGWTQFVPEVGPRNARDQDYVFALFYQLKGWFTEMAIANPCWTGGFMQRGFTRGLIRTTT